KEKDIRKHQEKKLNVPGKCETKKIPNRLPSDKEESSLHSNDKIRKSCSSTGSETSNSESVNNKHHKENIIDPEQNIMHSSVNVNSDDTIMYLNDYSLSIEKDNRDRSNVLHRNQLSKKDSSEENIAGGVYSVVCPTSSLSTKTLDNVTNKLSDSLEKLAQQIQFEPIATSSSRSTPTKLSRSLEEHTVAVEDNSAKMDSMFSRMKNKLGYSSSFKTKKELQQPQSNINESDGRRMTIQNDRVLKSTGSALESVKGEAKILDGQLKPCHSGSELDVLEQRVRSDESGDDLFISTESIKDSDGCKDQTDGQRKRSSITRGNRLNPLIFR
ncbi:hypothetical protein L9F63_011891, partial [Diploptera punctata]